jgi:methylenetetrahydrofolate dehydrogenase (NADP+)/methenyltetrahydrofolate cyclohydrolase
MSPTAQLMDGTSFSKEILATPAERAARFLARSGRQPCLAAVLVGDDPSSATYVRMKQTRCERAEIESRLNPSLRFDDDRGAPRCNHGAL